MLPVVPRDSNENPTSPDGLSLYRRREGGTMSESVNVFVEGWLSVLREAFEGGMPGQGTAFLDGTSADGKVNNGLFATLGALTPEQASDATVSGLSIAAHTAHVACYLEVSLRQARGDFGAVDWPGSFEPREVDAAGWATTRQRVQRAYEELVPFARRYSSWTVEATGGMAAILAHTAYHLGSIRQIVKQMQRDPS
jgi:hypothetical protein